MFFTVFYLKVCVNWSEIINKNNPITKTNRKASIIEAFIFSIHMLYR